MRSPVTETLLTIGKVAVLGYLAAVMLVYFVQVRLLFAPQPLAANELKAIALRYPGAQEVRLQAEDGVVLHGWFLRNAESAPDQAPLLIYYGGNAEEVSWLLVQAPRFSGYSLLLVNYRGYGGSGGRPGEAALYADSLRIYDYASGIATSIAVMGRSLGTAMAVHVAARRKVKAVTLVSPYASMTEVASHHYPFLPVSLLLRHRFEAAKNARRIDAPLLVLVAEHDSVVPTSHSRRLFEAWRGPRKWRMIQGAGHNDVSDAPAYWPAIGEFLTETRKL
jgi:uncharacterized protein